MEPQNPQQQTKNTSTNPNTDQPAAAPVQPDPMATPGSTTPGVTPPTGDGGDTSAPSGMPTGDKAPGVQHKTMKVVGILALLILAGLVAYYVIAMR